MSQCFMNTITRRNTIWIGHALRHDNITSHAIEGRMEEKEQEEERE